MTDDIDYQCWICPKCNDDHFRAGPCSPIKPESQFMPSPDDKSYIAEEYRKRVAENERLREALKKARQTFVWMGVDSRKWSDTEIGTVARGEIYDIDCALAEPMKEKP